MTDPAIYFENNVVKEMVLLDIMRKYDCDKFIFSSTASIFGEPEYVPIDEKHPQNPINAYGLKFNAFRYFNAAGASEKMGEAHKHENHLIPLVIQVALGKRKHINIYGTDYPTKDGICIRDYVHVLDLAQAHILGLENLEKHSNGKYNLGNGEGFSVLEIIEMVSKVSGRDIPIVEAPRRKRGSSGVDRFFRACKARVGLEAEV